MALIDELLHVYHDDELAGHWATCPVCQSIDTPRHKPYGSFATVCQSQRDLGKKFRLTGLLVCRRAETGTDEEFDSILVIVGPLH